MASAASSTPVKWVASDHDGLPMKRKQVAQACDSCRKRKKRCIHTENGDVARPLSRPGSTDPTRKAGHLPPGSLFITLHGIVDNPSDSTHPSNVGPNDGATSGSNEDDEEDATQVAANRLMELSSSRFISDLNPEGMFIQAAKPLPPNNTPYRDKNDLGVWLPPGASSSDGRNVDDDDDDDDDGDTARGANGASAAHGSATSRKAQSAQPGQIPHIKRRRSRNHANGAASSRSSARTAISEAAVAYERARYAFAKECLTVYPPDEDFAVLHRIYCEKVHPILPVLKESELERWASATASPPQATPTPPTSHAPPFSSTVFPTLIKQIISLSAATTDADAAGPHLRLEPNGPLLTPREFHHRLTDAVCVVLDADLIAHRFDYIRACILMSFFYQPSNEVDRNKPSFLCTQAAHHFQTIGAHLLGYRPEKPDDDAERIFCALWALDRLAAILYARPCMMHAYDNGKNPEDCAVKLPPCFRLFMSVIIWLDKVLHLYRPRQPFVMIDIPVYEALILDAQAEKLPANLLATIEVLYHTACVLSCRQPLSAFSDVEDASLNRDDRTYLPISIMNPRRSHSSDRIVWVTQTQPICLLPFVPYAVSIALSVQYKKMRYSRTPLFRTRARIGFKDIVGLLKSMGDVFINARVNAALGECIWKHMEKTASTLAREELEGGGGGGGNAAQTGAGSTTDNTAVSKKTSMAPPPSTTASRGDTFTSSAHIYEASSAAQASKGPGAASVGATASSAQTNTPGTITLVPGPVPGTAMMPPPTASTSLMSAGPSQAQAATQAENGTLSFLAGDYTNATVAPAATMAQTTTVAGTFGNSAAATATPAASAMAPSTVMGLQTTTAPLLDLSVLDTLDTDIDLFNNFDPSFDLGAIDTALEANLDMAMPQNWGPWNNLS